MNILLFDKKNTLASSDGPTVQAAGCPIWIRWNQIVKCSYDILLPHLIQKNFTGIRPEMSILSGSVYKRYDRTPHRGTVDN